MKLVRVRVDVGGTRGDQVWREMLHFKEVDPREVIFRLFCGHEAEELHRAGEWGEGTLSFEDFIAEYALAHYLRQPRVINAEIEASET